MKDFIANFVANYHSTPDPTTHEWKNELIPMIECFSVGVYLFFIV